MTIAIVVHGGAGNIAQERVESGMAGCRAAALVGMEILKRGGSALDAVEAAVRALEDNPHFNAGTGSCLTSEGNIEMDAGIMEGHTLQVGAVANIQRLKNPIALARKVLESPHVMLVARGAEEFAHENGFAFCAFEELLTERQKMNWMRAQGKLAAEPEDVEEKKHGTVGAVAVDSEGHLAAATSTGGIVNKRPGRVGDSPLVGCGFYADEHAAISCTGYGEDFIRLMIARRAADFVASGLPAQQAAEAAIAVLGARATGTGGLIVVDREGNVGYHWNTPLMMYAALQEA
ncbi:beta-aspartyl-peptidase (threonine type) [Thermosporothrix hazakensis]|jgi:beta-aspartyl-peptidase (threonine type)|uniref:Beta-aspartyl-peptidase (Threonine type) n=2 Tax=Thermosporothrix TaxID=768650 RepID=A0A326U3D6_THEHA|nr:isoaspartyl peptidase/L-asparaginase [Thermosporothrix hazakensis]PZW25640.1 beta-aspartyl-peptidase (threonine type) [Thermosporothrix hazakensis]BBH89935.1 peptidase T [Thermosporothrix sp. COM3]GCE48135.1 peptidase T [Thermosporothrix hazakensis]